MKRTTGVRRECAAVLGHVGAGEHADRRADQDRQHRHDDAADDRVEQAAFAARRRRHLREHGDAEARESFPEQGAEDQGQYEQAEPGREQGTAT